MEIYQIEKLPMPDDTRGRKKSKIRTTLEALDVGDTFFIPNKDLDVETSRQQVYRCAEMVVHLKECIKILERIEDMCERAINEVNEQT